MVSCCVAVKEDFGKLILNLNSKEYFETAVEKKKMNSLARLLRFLLEPNQAVLCTVLEELVGV